MPGGKEEISSASERPPYPPAPLVSCKPRFFADEEGAKVTDVDGCFIAKRTGPHLPPTVPLVLRPLSTVGRVIIGSGNPDIVIIIFKPCP